ncbi:hypothetical protein GS584_25805 [Rhodococcus hoagii]|nr:hypothetical protein [Prescottella equi]
MHLSRRVLRPSCPLPPEPPTQSWTPPPHLIVETTARRLCEAAAARPRSTSISPPSEPVLAAARVSAAARSATPNSHVLRASGIRQYVVLGAGLDTSAWRVPPSCHPCARRPGRCARVAWGAPRRRRHLGPRLPVAVDLAVDDPVSELVHAGLRVDDEPCSCRGRGVSMYLDADAVRRTSPSSAPSRRDPSWCSTTSFPLPPRSGGQRLRRGRRGGGSARRASRGVAHTPPSSSTCGWTRRDGPPPVVDR